MTAAGEILHCNETENAELVWCARGAGPGKILSSILRGLWFLTRLQASQQLLQGFT